MLEGLKTYLINLDEDIDRLKTSTQVLQSIDQSFIRYSAVKHSVGLVGCGLSHLNLLSHAGPSSLILEDDIALTSYEKYLGPIPKETDAIYLGVSNYGYVRRIPHGVEGSVLVSQISKDYKRIFNMCSTHAIIYLSDRYIRACQQIITHCLQVGAPFDLGLASIHRHFNIITPNSPWFYQLNQPNLTNIVLNP